MIPCLFYDTEITLLLKDIFVSKSCLKSVKTIRIYFKSWKEERSWVGAYYNFMPLIIVFFQRTISADHKCCVSLTRPLGKHYCIYWTWFFSGLYFFSLIFPPFFSRDLDLRIRSLASLYFCLKIFKVAML